MRIQELLETQETEFISALKDFLPLAIDVLKLNSLPRIKLVDSVHDPKQPTFGKYVNHDKTIYLAINDRHIIDIFRTLAHELVHYKQDLAQHLGKKSGETGSPEENEAHVLAGILMRNFDKKFPQYFKEKPVVLDENWKKALGIAALTGASIAGLRQLPAPDMYYKEPATKQQAIKVDPEKKAVLPSAIENEVKNSLIKHGIKGFELAQFLGQAAHETANFSAFEERGTKKYFINRYWKNERNRKILGNEKPNDAYRYRGRGLFHLTGRYNYQVCGEALGINLLNHPELAADYRYQIPIAVWFWKNRVRKLGADADYSDTAAITYFINKNETSKNIEKRDRLFQKYVELLDLK